LRTALVKQVLDVFGPWAGVKWKETSPRKLFDVWPGKAVYWELTCMLRADWYIVPQAANNEYIRDVFRWHPGLAEITRKNTKNITAPENIPFEEYDLVIAFDAILEVPRGARPLFAYYAQEHWDPLYRESLQKPVGGYDLFLAHMMDASFAVGSLPRAISFPYLHDVDLARSIFSEEKTESVWVDWRTLMTLGMKEVVEEWSQEAEAAAVRLEEVLDLPVRQRGKYYGQAYGVCDPPRWGDAAVYLRALAGSRYYVAVGQTAGAGQGLGEAAAVGCLCIGQSDKAYHRLICHPRCLCEDIAEMPRRLKAVVGSRDLQKEVLEFQDEALRRDFARGPLNLLEEAARIKSSEKQNHTTEPVENESRS
jgi:hypothetical protein